MKQTKLNALFFVNAILLIIYMGLSVNIAIQLDVKGVVPLLLSSLMLIDITYVSACNIKENRIISSFCGLLALESWYILLSVSNTPLASVIFLALSPIIWCVSISFMLRFLFQESGYRFQKGVSICLVGTCSGSLIGILVSDEAFALLYGIQFAVSWLCFIFVVVYHRKRIAFVLQAEWKRLLVSLVTIVGLFLAYYFSTMRVPEHLSNFGIYLPALLFSMSIHGIILKEHSSLPLSTVFSQWQMIWMILAGSMMCGLMAFVLRGGFPYFILLSDAMFVLIYACNIVLEFNLKHGKNQIIKESKYHATLRQLQKEEQLKLEFANFLHDDILQDLLSIKNMMNKADCPDVQNFMIEALDHMNTYIRDQMQDYHPTMLKTLSLKDNYHHLLEAIAQAFPRRHISIALDCPDTLFLVEPYQILVYRLMKELVTNVYKHSTGENVWITLAQDDGMIKLNVCDDGTADASALTAVDISQHRGLAMIGQRIKNMDGAMTIANNLPHGIGIQITLPMKGDASYQYFVGR